ncbi:DUF1772 domain-containing protein [Flavobacteriaceae bacterium S0825]|uniref:DUF1772 domain-containing protein n=1 Tax=Gaetbulibacter sp. S0825 TaxID=2720084 RepID=UPI0014322F2A|nr:DUF1772 domain-containing protein [Gaetbulibacter sp. S0825]MCK0110505.1 DUF1772 domain-containing protein [Flavobacteriaceae bacterium S0825]NIX66134.1 DUF1772 domain-containing protein [Gaetbulibacter sp. S0825]
MTNLLITLIISIMGAQFGVALTSSIIVHPILKMVSRPSAIEVFKPFFDKTHKAVLTMSIVVSVLALILSFITKNWWWFGISALMHLNGPYTLKYMMPTNRRLMADNVDPNSDQTKKDLLNWGSLHAVRTIWNGLIFLAFVVLLVYFVK